MPAITKHGLALLFLATLFPAFTVQEIQGQPGTEAEMKKLLGTWEGFAVEGTGEKADRGPVHVRITISEGKMSAVDLGKENRDMGNGTFTLGTGQKIKHLDAKGVVLPGKRERTFLGIYELDGDTLRWCVDNRQAGRPTEFRTGGGNFLLVLKRKK